MDFYKGCHMTKCNETWVILNDIQIPFEDTKVLYDLIIPFIEDLRPDGVILNGDVVDMYSISDFDKNPLTPATVAVEIRRARVLMSWLATRVSGERIWLGGNHEDRLRKWVWKNPSLLSKFPLKVRENIVTELDIPSIFGITDYGFTWAPYGAHHMLGKLMVTHGNMVSKHSGLTARAHFDKYGTSILIGHTHRLGVYYKRDSRGVHGAWENGCLCKMTPEYAQYPNWQQGFSVVHVSANGLFNVQQIPLLPGPSFMYGNERIGRR